MSPRHPGSRQHVRLVPALLAVVLGLAFAFAAWAQDPGDRGRTAPEGTPIPRDVQMSALKRLQQDLLMQGARSAIANARREARERREAPKRGARRGVHVRRVTEADAPPPPQDVDRQALPSAVQATNVAPTNTRCNNPAGDAAGAGQAEESIASIGNNVLVAWNDGQGFNLVPQDVQGYGFSTDGGATFTDGGVPAKPPGLSSFTWSSDPVVTVNEKTGKFYYCGLCNTDATHNGVGVAIGHFSGVSFLWDTVVVVRSVANSTTFLDKQWIAADSATGNVYVTNTTFTTTSNHIDFYRSLDGGVSWSAPTQLSAVGDNGWVQGSRPAVGPNGEVYAVWYTISQTVSDDNFFFRASADHGGTWGTQSSAGQVFAQFGTGAPGFNRERGITFPSIAVDRTLGPNRGRVYVAWNETFDIQSTGFFTNSGKVEVEPNGFAAVATPFTPGQTLRGTISAASPPDLDWFKTTLTAGQTLQVWADSLWSSSTYTLRIFAPNPDSLQRLAFGGDITAGTGVTQAFYSFTAPVSGTYYLRIAPAFTTTPAPGSYRIETVLSTSGGYRARDQRDVFVASTANGGASWSVPTRVNDDAVGFDDFLPEVSVAADGYPYVFWFDFRDDTFGSRANQYMSRSTDAGATWAPSQVITTAQSNFTTSASNIAPNEGDYSHAYSDARFVRPTWADGRSTSSVDVWSTSVDTWHSLTGCPSDATVNPSQVVPLAWTVNNLNPLFANGYAWTLTNVRGWSVTGSGTVGPVAALGSAPINVAVTVPDSASDGDNAFTFTLTNAAGLLAQQCTVTLTVTGAASVGPQSLAFALAPARPNPAHGAATLGFSLPSAGHVRLQVFGLSGELVRTLVDGERAAGPNAVSWDGRDEDGRAVAAGTYFVRLEGFGRSARQRMVWMR